MAFVKLLDADRLPEGALCEVKAGDRPIAVSHVGGKYFAVDGVCPHAGGPLGQGALHGHQIVCPWHAWEFDCRTGECDFNDTKLRSYPVTFSGDALWIEIDA